jgi:NADPH-dependent 2,4-dienoyl-CoA reductase/sulfur reductase-like enzyme
MRLPRISIAAGVHLEAIIDSRPDTNSSIEVGATRVLTGAMVTDAHGGKKLSSISVVKDGRTETLQVDALAMAGGFSPIIHLACHRGARPVWSDEQSCFLAPGVLNGLTLAGSVNATDGIAASLVEGVRQGRGACRKPGLQAGPSGVWTGRGRHELPTIATALVDSGHQEQGLCRLPE